MDVLVESESKIRKKPASDTVHLGWVTPEDSSTVRLVGRTEGDEIVVFDGPRELIGTVTSVRGVGATNLTVKGERNGAVPEVGEQDVRIQPRTSEGLEGGWGESHQGL
jgi:hypothetical protein